MLINVDQKLKNFNGSSIKDEEGKEITLKNVCINVLLMHIPKEEINGEEKFKRFKLAHRLDAGESIDLNSSDISLLKDLITKVYSPLIVGQAYLMLENKTLNEKGEEVCL